MGFEEEKTQLIDKMKATDLMDNWFDGVTREELDYFFRWALLTGVYGFDVYATCDAFRGFVMGLTYKKQIEEKDAIIKRMIESEK